MWLGKAPAFGSQPATGEPQALRLDDNLSSISTQAPRAVQRDRSPPRRAI